MGWQIGLVANGVVTVAYLCIAGSLVSTLRRTGQLRSNRLGTATALIFLTCGVHHGGHTVHMVLPLFGVEPVQGLAMRASYDWQMAAWDVVTAAIGVYYWTLRRAYTPLLRGARLFEDMRQREQQALELNDNVLQGLVVAKMALELDRPDDAGRALDTAIEAASGMIGDLLGTPGSPRGNRPLLRSKPAVLGQDRQAG